MKIVRYSLTNSSESLSLSGTALSRVRYLLTRFYDTCICLCGFTVPLFWVVVYDPVDVCLALLQLDLVAVELGEVVHGVVLAVGSEDETHSFGNRRREPERTDRVLLSLFVLQVVDTVDYHYYLAVIHYLIAIISIKLRAFTR